MELVIEAMDESDTLGLPALSVCHYGEVDGDAMRDSSQGQPHLLVEAKQVFAPEKYKVVKAKGEGSTKPKLTAVKQSTKNETGQKKAVYTLPPPWPWIRPGPFVM